MHINTQEVAQRMERFETVCRDKGIKLTQQRMEIFREIAQTGDHPDAEQVFKRVRKRLPTVSLDTVYRTLWLLNDLGLVAILGSSRERTRFDANLNKHHHFVCRECGFTRDFYSNNFDALHLPDAIRAFGEARETHVEVRGICQGCLAKKQGEVP